MFGDSRWDYMTDEEKKAVEKERTARDKLVRAQAKKQHLLNLSHYTLAELLAEIKRRSCVTRSARNAKKKRLINLAIQDGQIY